MSATQRRGRLVRGVFLVLGFVSLAVAAVGVFLPLVPVTGPTLLAAFFFARSSPRFDRWLLEHRWFGPIVRDWRAGAGFTVRAKIVAVVAICASFVFSGLVAVPGTAGRVLLAMVGFGVCTYVLSRPTKPAAVSGVARTGSPRRDGR